MVRCALAKRGTGLGPAADCCKYGYCREI